MTRGSICGPGFVFTVEDGLMTRGRVFASRARALEAAGLSE